MKSKNKAFLIVGLIIVVLILGFFVYDRLSNRAVVLYYDYGNIYKTRVSKNAKYSSLPVKEKKGYVFVGWSKSQDKNNLVNIEDQISDISTLYAIYIKGVYQLLVDPNGGLYDDSLGTKSFNMEYESSRELHIPTKVGYTFENWSISGEKSTIDGNKFTMGVEDTKVIANYKANHYKVIIDYAGGSLNGKNKEEVTMDYNSSIQIGQPKRDGYIFAGYKVSGGEFKNETFVLNVAKDVKITAKWITNNTKGNKEPDNITINPETEVIVNPISQPEQSQINESDISNPVEQTKPVQPVEPDKPVEPVKPIEPTNSTLTVYYYLMASDGKTYILDDTQTYEFETIKGTKAPIKEYTNYISPKQYVIESSNEDKSYEVSYKYERQQFNLTIDGVIEKYYFGQKIELSIPYKNGYDFVKFNYNHGSLINNVFEMPTCDAEITFEFKAIKYSITYELNGSTLNNKKEYYSIEDKFELEIPIKDGYEFLGWSTGSKSELTKNVKIENQTGNLYFIAVFKPLVVNVTFIPNDGTEQYTKTYNYKDKIGKLPTLSRKESTFIGWFDEEGNQIDENYVLLDSCTITGRFKTNLPDNTAVRVIESLASNPDLSYDNTKDNNLRYIGKNPNNYVSFNGELWRIVGVMYNVQDKDSVSPKLKLIRDDYLTNYLWDSTNTDINSGYGTNNYSTSEVNKYLNEIYNLSSNYDCALAKKEIKAKIDELKANGEEVPEIYIKYQEMLNTCGLLTKEANEFIVDVNYKLGSNGTNSWVNSKAIDFYNFERSNNSPKVCNNSALCNDTEERNLSWQGKLGLMYLSDYTFAVGGDKTQVCLNTPVYKWWSNSSCLNNNWLNKGIEYTMTPVGSKYYAYRVFTTGKDMESSAASNFYNIRPAVYINSLTTIERGTGSKTDPFILGRGW